MKEIKTKEFVDAQEVFEGVTDLGDRMRRGLGRGGDYARNLADDGQVSSTEYASDQLQYAADGICYEAGHIVVGTVKNTFRSARKINNHSGAHRKTDAPDVTPQKHPKPSHISNIRTVQKADGIIQQTAQSTGKATIKTAQKTITDGQRALKASQEATKTSMKATQEAARAVEKTARATTAAARRAAELLREAAIEAAKAAAKLTAAAAKAAAAAVEEIVAAIAAGGWVVLVIIAVIIIILVVIIAIIGYLGPSNATPK